MSERNVRDDNFPLKKSPISDYKRLSAAEREEDTRSMGSRVERLIEISLAITVAIKRNRAGSE